MNVKTDDVVERVARVVDPETWQYRDECLTRREEWDREIHVGWGNLTFEEWANRGVGKSLGVALAALEASHHAELVEALEQIRDLNGSNFDSDRAWALAMQLRARVVLQGWLSEPHPTTGEA